MGLMLLTVTGRRTGRRYAIPVGYQRDGDALIVLVSEAPTKQWWRNYLDPAPVEVRVGRRQHSGMGVVVAPSSDEFVERAEGTLCLVPGIDRVFGIRYDKRKGLSSEQVKQLGQNIAIVRIDLDT